jgi:hypothetical protein
MAPEYTIVPLSLENAREITAWRYEPPYDLYDLSASDLTGFMNPEYRYHQVLDPNGIRMESWWATAVMGWTLRFLVGIMH